MNLYKFSFKSKTETIIWCDGAYRKTFTLYINNVKTFYSFHCWDDTDSDIFCLSFPNSAMYSTEYTNTSDFFEAKCRLLSAFERRNQFLEGVIDKFMV